MIEHIIWIISFISLFLSIVWLNIFFFNLSKEDLVKFDYFPEVTIGVPAYNEEEGMPKTLKSLYELDYPKDKYKVIVINDGSKDKTLLVSQEFAKTHPDFNVVVVDKKNGGKAAALNTAIAMTTTEYFSCVDADSEVSPDSLKYILNEFSPKNSSDCKLGAVISSIKIKETNNFLEKIQRLEYISGIMFRKLRSSFNTLATTHGVLSTYKTSALKEIGGFDVGNITEDFEIALHLREQGYVVRAAPNAFTYTTCPNTMKSLWNQRIRWSRGYIYNNLKYKKMMFNTKYSILGYFQMPMDLMGIPILLFSTSVIGYNLIIHTYETVNRMLFINGYWSRMFSFPTFREFILAQNIKIMLPIMISTLCVLFLFAVAHRLVKERIKSPFIIWAYFFVLPYFNAVYWFSALSKEVRKTKKKWRSDLEMN